MTLSDTMRLVSSLSFCRLFQYSQSTYCVASSAAEETVANRVPAIEDEEARDTCSAWAGGEMGQEDGGESAQAALGGGSSGKRPLKQRFPLCWRPCRLHGPLSGRELGGLRGYRREMWLQQQEHGQMRSGRRRGSVSFLLWLLAQVITNLVLNTTEVYCLPVVETGSPSSTSLGQNQDVGRATLPGGPRETLPCLCQPLVAACSLWLVAASLPSQRPTSSNPPPL